MTMRFRDLGAPMHTTKDAQALIAAGVEPSLTQPREHPIGALCGHGRTANQAGFCDRPECYRAPAMAVRAAS